jgi:phage terminase large subunit-like protein
MIKFDTDKYYFDEKAAYGVVNFIESHIRHIKGPQSGQLIKLEDWQKEDIIYPLFGIKDKITGFRRFKFAYIEVAKKNGKSALLSAIILVVLLFDKDEGAEIFSAASTRDQAKIVFGDACKMIGKDPFLKEKLQVYQNSVIFGNKSYKPLSADIGTNDGINANLVCFDELHRQPNRGLYDVLIGAMAAKDQPLFIMITTAGSDLNSICYEQHEYAINVRDGIIKDDRFLPVIYAADVEDDPFIESTWKKANPNYGISVKKDYIKEQADKARSNKAYLNTFLRLHLNIWTNVETVFIKDEDWQKCGAEIDITRLNNEIAYGGLDLSSKNDISGFSLIFPPSDREYYPNKYILLNWSWLPEETPKDSANKNNNNYQQWVHDKWIELTSGNVIDHDYIISRIIEICIDFRVMQIGYDPFRATHVAAKLIEEGLDLRAFRQGDASMTTPTDEFDKSVTKGEILHNNNPVMRWQVSNGVLKFNSAGNLFKVGKNQSHQKIDNFVTSIMAYGLSIEGEDNSNSSYMDENEVMFVEL